MSDKRIIVLMHEDLVPPEAVERPEILATAEWKTEYDVVTELRKLGHEARTVGVARDLTPIRDAIVDTNYQSLVGPVAWKGGPTNPVPNCCTTPLVGGQWKKGTKFKYDLNVVFNQPAPSIPTDSPFEAIHYT